MSESPPTEHTFFFKEICIAGGAIIEVNRELFFIKFKIEHILPFLEKYLDRNKKGITCYSFELSKLEFTEWCLEYG